MSNSNDPVVLVVDDDSRVRDAIIDILDLVGVCGIPASNGEEGLELFQENPDSIELVILDLMMPVMNGEDTLRELQSVDPTVKVLVSSGFGEAATVRKMVGNGAVGFLHKPYDLHALISAVKSQFRNPDLIQFPAL